MSDLISETPWSIEEDNGYPVILDRTGMLVAGLGYANRETARNCDANARMMVHAPEMYTFLDTAIKELAACMTMFGHEMHSAKKTRCKQLLRDANDLLGKVDGERS